MPTTRVYNNATGKTYYTEDLPAANRMANPLYRLLFFLFNLLELVLALRFVMVLLRASLASGFVRFIYNLTNPFVIPFKGLVAPTISGGLVIEWTTLIAMIAYAIIFYALISLFRIAFPE